MLLVVGANGQLGTELQAQLGNRAEYVDVAEIDISCEDAVRPSPTASTMPSSTARPTRRWTRLRMSPRAPTQ